MRFNNRACALMDIPDLPQGAFEHIGDKKIKLQGGGGFNPISAITDPISSVLGTDGGGGGILGAVEDVAQGAGNALADVDKFVGREIPGGWVTVGAATVPFLAPEALALAAPEAAFVGATETGLATLAGEGALADTIGATLLAGGAEVAAAEAAAQATTLTGAFDAANLAAQGLGENAIAQNLTASGIDSFIAQDMARLAAEGYSEEAIAKAISYSYTPAELAGTGLTSMANTLPAKGLSAAQALQGARLASGLLSGQQQPQQQQPQQMMIGGRQTNPYGGVDYSGLLNLLQPRMAARNPNSLLG